MSLGLNRLRLLAVAAGAVLCMAAAGDPAERLPDPGQESHARRLFAEFRCVVCQNESIDDSEADLARDLRQIIRQQVAQGRSDAQIRRFLVERYGEFILLKPRFSIGNAALWLPPILIVLAGGALFARRLGRRIDLEPSLTPSEEQQVQALADRGIHDTVTPKTGPGGDAGLNYG
jgi:cytochrome c-type biogenesis protein CcmH